MVGLFIGLCGGAFGGLIGLGGGIIMIPLIVSIARTTQHKAHGTSLIAVVSTACVGSLTYFFYNAVDWKAAVMLAASATVTARFGAVYANSLPAKQLKRYFGIMLVFVSILLLAKGFFPKLGLQPVLWQKMVIFILTGVVSGFVAGMMGVGGGAIMIPPMILLGGMDQHIAQGTSLLAMIPAGISGSLTHYRLRNVETKIAWSLATGAVIGSWLGSAASNMIPELYLRYIFVIVLVWLGTKFIKA